MSSNRNIMEYDNWDSADQQTAFVFAQNDRIDSAPARPSKRRKITKPSETIACEQNADLPAYAFERLLNGAESQESAALRQDMFERSWAETEVQIQAVLDEANEGTLTEVVSFIQSSPGAADTSTLPTGFIVTGPNISSQGLLFDQLSARFKRDIMGPAVLLRSGDASNLKNVLKLIIRELTDQRQDSEDEEADVSAQFGRKLLNYDLEMLHKFVKAHQSQSIVVVFQDSEAFDNELLAEMIQLFRSWMDRIPFVLLLGIATSVTLFYERIPRSASRCLSGSQFYVENNAVILERIFKKTVASAKAPLRIGPGLVANLMARQRDHVQSVQAFTAALKYAYMCHFYSNALSILNNVSRGLPVLGTEQVEAVRMLPSFRSLIEDHLEKKRFSSIHELFEDDKVLIDTVKSSAVSGKQDMVNLLRAIHLLKSLSPEPVQIVELYLNAFEGTLDTSEAVSKILDSIKRMTPGEIVEFGATIRNIIETGYPEMDLDGWSGDATEFLSKLATLSEDVAALIVESETSGDPLRSTYAIHSKGLRTTVIAQRVQLSYEKSTLSKQDQLFIALVDRLFKLVREEVTCGSPFKTFLHEAWLYDSDSPHTEVFNPRPRHAVEHALTSPHDYLQCVCCRSDEGLSATQPTTASVYQMYLQAGSLINIADLWSTFLDNQNQNDDEEFDEREALVRFYQSLVDLKLLGMVKQSKKKVDHLAKVLWNGL